MVTVHKTEKQSVYSYKRTSDGVSINITPVFIEQESRPDENFYLWAYQVRIENKGTEDIKILDRQWSVIDGQGATKHITGTGVFEDQPTLKPGDAFEYTNTIPLKTTSGLIAGKYALEAPQGQIREIDAPMFSLDSPYNTQSLH